MDPDEQRWHVFLPCRTLFPACQQHMWAELSRGNQLEYLGREGQEKVKGALTVLAAYCSLREHPLQAGMDSPQQVQAEPLDCGLVLSRNRQLVVWVLDA